MTRTQGRRPWRDRLAADVPRGYTASLVGFLAGLPFWVRPDLTPSGLKAWVAETYLALFAGMFLAYPLLTWWVLRRREGGELQRLLVAGNRARPTVWQRAVRVLGGAGAFWWALEIVLLSLGAVTVVALDADLRRHPVVLALSAVLVVSGWLTMLAAYTITYAREFMTSGGLDFPGEEPPVSSDFLYLAMMMQATFSGSDVSVTTARMRRMVTAHSLLSFVFSTVVVALLVSAMLGAAA